MVKIAIWLLACIISAILYRCGGKGLPYNTKYRDLGCPLVMTLLVWFLYGIHLEYWWAYLVFFGLSFGALTTYWDFLFGYDNFWFHGFMCSLPGLIFYASMPWYIILARIIICTVGMGLVSKLLSNDVEEECGRGIFFIL